MQQHQVFPAAQQMQQCAGVPQSVEIAGLVEGVVGHQEHVPAAGDFRAVEQGLQGIEFQCRHPAAGIPEVEIGPRRVEGNGRGLVAQPAHERITRRRGGLRQVGARQRCEKLAMVAKGRADVEVVVAGHGKGAAPGQAQRFGQARGRFGEFAFQAEVESVARVQGVVDRLAPQKIVQAVELLDRGGVFRAAAQVEIEKRDEALGVEDFRRAERPARERQMHVAEMQDAEAHAAHCSGAAAGWQGPPCGFAP